MYQILIIYAFIVVSVLFFAIAAKVISINSIRLFSRLHELRQFLKQPRKYFAFIQSVAWGLTGFDTESYAYINKLISTSRAFDRSKIYALILGSKVAQYLLLIALLSPPQLFSFFIIFLFLWFRFNENRISNRALGCIMGFILLKCSIEAIFVAVSLTNPSVLFPDFFVLHILQYSGIASFAAGISISLLFQNFVPAMFVGFALAYISQLSLVKLILLVIAVGVGYACKASFLSKSYYSIMEKALLNISVFYLFNTAIFCVICLIIISLMNINYSNVNINKLLFIKISFLQSLSALLTALIMFYMQRRITYYVGLLSGLMSNFFHVKSKYKYMTSYGYNYTRVGLPLLTNELILSSRESLNYLQVFDQYINKRDSGIKTYQLHQSFLSEFIETEHYLQILLHSDESKELADEIAVVSKFYYNMVAIEKNFFEKSLLLEKMKLISSQNKKVEEFIASLLESEDAIAFLYHTILEQHDKAQLDTLSTISQEKNEILYNIQTSYLEEEGSQQTNEFCIQLTISFEIDMWLIHQQAALLKQMPSF